MMRAKRMTPALLLAAAACTAPQPAVRRAPVLSAPPFAGRGLEAVMGKDARALVVLFGDPDQDVREERARRLQFASAACVLDAYLYPSANGREAIVTWVDARTPQGDDFDRASCVAALSRRGAAR